MHDSKGYYKLLSLQPGSSIPEVKRAYARLLQEFHPDTGALARKAKALKDAAEQARITDELVAKCKKLNDARAVLTDEDKKRLYDQGHDESAGAGYDMSGFDIFDFMGGGRRDRGPKKVANTEFQVKFSLRESYTGRKKTFSVRRDVICTKCKGKGGEKSYVCTTCNGEGEVAVKKQMGLMFSIDRSMCRDCQGEGSVFEGAPCTACQTKRYCQEHEKVAVNFGKGFKEGDNFLCKGKGDEHVGCIPGDLVLTVSVQDDPNFKRVENHLVTTADVSLAVALYGGTVSLRHIDDSVLDVKIERFGNLREDVLIVKNAGFPGGDLYIVPNIPLEGLDIEALRAVLQPETSEDEESPKRRSGTSCKAVQGRMPSEKKKSRSESFKGNIFSQFFRGGFS